MDFKQSDDFIEICRTCLQKITDASELFYVDVSESATVQSIRFKLEDCIPSINLNLTSNPIICKNCFDAINFMHTFKENCLQYDFYLKNYMNSFGVSNIDLGDIVKTNEKLWLSWVSPDVKSCVEDNVTLESYSVPIKEEPIEEELNTEVINDEKPKVEPSYGCNDCSYKTTSKSKLLIHIQSHFVESTLFEIIKEEAEENDEESDNREDVDYVPYSSKRYICKICKHSTDRRGKLKIHMNTHLRKKYKYEKPVKKEVPAIAEIEFKCARCAYTTICNEQLISVDKQQLIAANILEEEKQVDHLQPSTSAASNANCNLGSEFSWNRNTTLLLISKYKSLKDDFRDPKIKKKGLWAKIKEHFLKEGYEVTEELLDRKFRNLKKTYTGIKDATNKTGRGRISWEHFDSFEDLFREDKCVNVPRTISSITPLSNASEGTLQTSEGQAESTLTKSPSAHKMSTLFRQRKKQLELEEKRVTEITLLRKAIETSNNIQKERNELLKLLLEKR
ncbi:hypothetical protein RN001_011055 [Aquatica leii]|uniref:C2H2-type domain-containing protein n=1 Tax=Aquatica leii TaxID=1421715 RepID=A0AAN7SGF6_9COLE|nr:hypothetical protein RN001_011055 [Aquatica leii]